MFIEFGLAIATFLVALIGVRWENKSAKAKNWLIVLATITTACTMLKAFSDDSDKKFTQRVLESMLNPSNAAYKALQSDVARYFAREYPGPNLDQWQCYHGGPYMDCFVWSSKDRNAKNTLALNADEIGAMYKNDLAKTSNNTLIKNACEKHYKPADFDEEFKDKVGTLATSIFWQKYGQWPRYDYDDNRGIEIGYLASHEDKTVVLKPEELKGIPEGRSCDVFFRVDQIIRKKYGSEVQLLTEPGSEPYQ